MDKIQKLNYLRDGIYPYNYIVEESPLGEPWVRLRSYPCVSFPGEMETAQEFDADELIAAFEKNQGIKNPEDFMANLDKHVKSAGPPYDVPQRSYG